MKAVIRVRGLVNINEDIENTLNRLKLRRKYTCVVLEDSKILNGMIKKIRSFVAYGEIDKKTLIELIKYRGQKLDKTKKIDPEKIYEILLKEKKFDNTGIKPFFRLHPPRGGVNTKDHFPKGILGDNKEKINDLIRRML
ncbi:MAG: uL30 family ribosomal protein [Candidatus Pacearchaeota archaeon]